MVQSLLNFKFDGVKVTRTTTTFDNAWESALRHKNLNVDIDVDIYTCCGDMSARIKEECIK
jgi:hypothetical protein